jgi:hypothetical protein
LTQSLYLHLKLDIHVTFYYVMNSRTKITTFLSTFDIYCFYSLYGYMHVFHEKEKENTCVSWCTCILRQLRIINLVWKWRCYKINLDSNINKILIKAKSLEALKRYKVYKNTLRWILPYTISLMCIGMYTCWCAQLW